ncbi:Cholesterol 25-hydroxylase-like protein [Dissostichus eleginoides]|uniref:Cholesterol 25-hydroxylase-like protein n=1 Tax=Dissostichus eleginoides TaxID=100907 RepID=A0AAD9BGQ9_DISEL|nr:Cholesterol 25-hydroxylase-like protein [Dissostichus eleginoides]
MMLQPLWDLLRGHSSLLLSPLFPCSSPWGLPHLLRCPTCCWTCWPSGGPRCAGTSCSLRAPSAGLSAELPVSDALQPPGVPAANHAAAWVPKPRPPAGSGPAPSPPPGPGVRLPAAVRLTELHLAPAAPQGAPQLHLRLTTVSKCSPQVHHSSSSTWALTTEATGAMETLSLGFFSGCTPSSWACTPQPAGLLPAQHLALCGGPLRLRPALGHAPPLSPPPVRGRAAPRPAPPQLLLQLRTILHPLGASSGPLQTR